MSETDPRKEKKMQQVSSPPSDHPETLASINSAAAEAEGATVEGRTFSQLLAGAMVSPVGSPRGEDSVVPLPSFLASPPLLETQQGFAGQFAMIHQAVLATVTAQAHLHLLTPEALTNSSPQPVLTPISPPSLHQTPEGNSSTPEAGKPLLKSDSKAQSAQTVVKTNPNDGYNWRKYGQKQVKSSDRSRSYYKCTNVNCSAKKKVERCPNGKETEITYCGQHNHGLPKKNKSLKERGTQSGGPTRPSPENETLDLPNRKVNGSDPSTSKREHISGIETPEPPMYCSSDGEGDFAKAEEEHGDEPDPKRRLSESTTPYSAPVLRTVKEPKIIVQSSCDMARISDGYKWRKYGQKIVKGNPNPRSYYRCTHDGCPVRKHVERASDDVRAILITYEGKHNHDQPAYKSDGDQPNTALLIAAAVALVNQDEELHSLNSLDRNSGKSIAGDKAKELGGEKAIESAQTLLSMGFNSSTGEAASGTNSDGIKCRSLFNKNRSAVPVQNS